MDPSLQALYNDTRINSNPDSAVVPGAALRVSDNDRFAPVSRADELEHNYRHNMKGRNPSFGSEAFKAGYRGLWNAGAFVPALVGETGEWLYEKATGDDSESDGFDIDGAMTKWRRDFTGDWSDRGDWSQMGEFEKAALLSAEYGTELVAGGLGLGAALRWGIKGGAKALGKSAAKDAPGAAKEGAKETVEESLESLGKRTADGTASAVDKELVKKVKEKGGPAAAFVRRGMENAGGKLGVAAAFGAPFWGAMINGSLNDYDLASMEAGGRFGQLATAVPAVARGVFWAAGQGARKFNKSRFMKEMKKQGQPDSVAAKKYEEFMERQRTKDKPTPEMDAEGRDVLQAFMVRTPDGKEVMAVSKEIQGLLKGGLETGAFSPTALAHLKYAVKHAPVRGRGVLKSAAELEEIAIKFLEKTQAELRKKMYGKDPKEAADAWTKLNAVFMNQMEKGIPAEQIEDGVDFARREAVQQATMPYLNKNDDVKAAAAARANANNNRVGPNGARIDTQNYTKAAVEAEWKIVGDKYRKARAAGSGLRFKFPISDEVMKRAVYLEEMFGRVISATPKGVQNFFKKAKARNAENDEFRAGVGEGKLGSVYIPAGVDRASVTPENVDVAMTGGDLIDLYHILSKQAHAADGMDWEVITKMKQDVLDIANRAIDSDKHKLFAERWRGAMAEYKRLDEMTHGNYSAAARAADKTSEKAQSLFTKTEMDGRMMNSLIHTYGGNNDDVILRQVRGDFAEAAEGDSNPAKFIHDQLRGVDSASPWHGAEGYARAIADANRTTGGEQASAKAVEGFMKGMPVKVRTAMEDETRNIVMRYLDGSDSSWKFFQGLTSDPAAARKITDLMNSAPPGIKNEYLQAVAEYAVTTPNLFSKISLSGKKTRLALENILGEGMIGDLEKWAAHAKRDVLKSLRGVFDQTGGEAINIERYKDVVRQFGEQGALRLVSRRFFEKYTENFGRPNARPMMGKMDEVLLGGFTPLNKQLPGGKVDEIGDRLRDSLRKTADGMVLRQLGINSGEGIDGLIEQVVRQDGSFDENALRTLREAMNVKRGSVKERQGSKTQEMARNIFRKRIGERMADAMQGDDFDAHIQRFGNLYKEVLGVKRYLNILAAGKLLQAGQNTRAAVDSVANKSWVDPIAEATGLPLERVAGRIYQSGLPLVGGGSGRISPATALGTAGAQATSAWQHRGFVRHYGDTLDAMLAGALGKKAMREVAVNDNVLVRLFAYLRERDSKNAKPLWDLLGGEKYLVAGALSGGGGAGGRTHGDMQNQQLQYNLTREAEERGSVESERAKKELQTYQRFYDPRHGTKILRGQRQRGEVQ